MYSYKRLFTLIAAVFLTFGMAAQNKGSKSSYSRFGLGLTTDEVSGFSQGMGGAGIALPSGNRLNIANPASIAQVDSLSFLFDVGATLSMGKQDVGNNRVKTLGGSFDYAVLGLRMHRGLGLTAGFMPYTTISYDFYQTTKVGSEYNTTAPITSSQSFTGDGGCHRAFLGIGWNPVHNLNIGVTASLIWGNYAHSITQAISVDGVLNSNYNAMIQTQTAKVLTYRLDFGVQYPVKITPEDVLTFGAIATLGHNTHTTVTLNRYDTLGDSIVPVSIPNAIDIPYSYGAGIAWQHSYLLTLAADYRNEQWANCRVPLFNTSGTTSLSETYTSSNEAYRNRHRVNVGIEINPADVNSRTNFFKKMRYRFGVLYSTPYLRIKDNAGVFNDGPSEYGLSCGFGIPIINRINNRSIVNLSFEWKRRQPSMDYLIKEDYFMIHLGITFNERWFMKYKIL